MIARVVCLVLGYHRPRVRTVDGMRILTCTRCGFTFPRIRIGGNPR